MRRSLIRRLVVPGLVYLSATIVFTAVPLLNYLGFESSVAVAILATVVGSLFMISILSKGDRSQAEALSGFKTGVTLNFALLLIPLCVLMTNALFVKNCSFGEGLAFFFLLPVVTVWFVSCLSLFCVVYYRHPRLIFFGLVALSLLYALASGYFTPAIYSYNFFYGYFPGLTYDEVLGIGWPLVAFRGLTVVAGGVLLWMAILILESGNSNGATITKGKRLLVSLTSSTNRWKSIVLMGLLALLVGVRCELGFESTAGHIQRTLGGVLETEHFAIYYPPGSITAEEIRWIAAEHEFQLKSVTEALSLPSAPKVNSYIYPSSAEKQRLIGAGNTNIAKPWRNEIHLSLPTLDATLRHELVHVVAGRFGMPVLKANVSTGLTEGIAMAVEWDWGNRTLHQYAAAMRRFGVAPDIQMIMTPLGFVSRSSSISYVLAGSFCRFLIDRFGIRRMMILYGSGDYQQVYDRSLEELVREWHAYLDRIRVPDGERDVVDVLFRQPPIFGKVCARVIASRNARARNQFSDRDYGTAAKLYRLSFEESGGYESLAGFLASSYRRGDYGVVISSLDSIIVRSSNPGQYLPLFLTIGDAFWMQENTPRARELYERVRIADFSESYTEAAALRLAILADSTWQDRLKRVVLSDSPDSVRLAELENISGTPVVVFLRGRALFRLQRFEEASAALSAASFSQDQLEVARLLHLGGALFRSGRLQDAKAAFWTSLNYQSSEVAVVRVGQWIERCEWMDGTASSPIRSMR